MREMRQGRADLKEDWLKFMYWYIRMYIDETNNLLFFSVKLNCINNRRKQCETFMISLALYKDCLQTLGKPESTSARDFIGNPYTKITQCISVPNYSPQSRSSKPCTLIKARKRALQ